MLMQLWDGEDLVQNSYCPHGSRCSRKIYRGARLAIARGWATAVTAETIWYNHAVGFYRKSRCKRAKLVTPCQNNSPEALLVEEIDHILEWHSAASADWGPWLLGTTKVDRKRYRLVRKLNRLRDKLVQQRELTLARSSDLPSIP